MKSGHQYSPQVTGDNVCSLALSDFNSDGQLEVQHPQHLTKTKSCCLGLVDFPVCQAGFIGPLPDGHAWSTMFMAHLTVD